MAAHASDWGDSFLNPQQSTKLNNGAHLGLHSKPLDAAIRRVPARYCPSGRHGRRICWNNTKHLQALLLASNYGALRSLVVTIILGPKLDPLLSSLMQQRQQALFKCEMPWLELMSLWRYLAIKHCQGTKSKMLLSNHKACQKSWRILCALLVVSG